MANINVRIESKRGCGYRQQGGFYLVLGGGIPKGCGMLPIPVPEMIKVSRGPRWIECKFILAIFLSFLMINKNTHSLLLL